MGVIVTDIVVGEGEPPNKFDIVEIHYTGWRKGSDDKFASSAEDFEESFHTEIGTGKVIKGWDEGIMKMAKGGKARLSISHDYAYGASGYPPTIPPHTDLIYLIELLDITRRAQPQPSGSKKKNVTVTTG